MSEAVCCPQQVPCCSCVPEKGGVLCSALASAAMLSVCRKMYVLCKPVAPCPVLPAECLRLAVDTLALFRWGWWVQGQQDVCAILVIWI
jgi:hypothetical protein